MIVTFIRVGASYMPSNAFSDLLSRIGRLGRVSTLVFLFVTLEFTTPTRAQCPEGWLPGESYPGVYGTDVRAFAVLPEGDMIIGGSFEEAGGLPANNIVRYSPSTRTWSLLGTGLNLGVRSIVSIPNGEVIVAGGFTSAGGMSARRIARYSPTTLQWSSLGTGLNGSAETVAVLPDGTLLVGGSFTTAGSVSANRIARYDLVTGEWSAVGEGTNASVNAFKILSDGDVLVGGSFTTAGGIPARCVARFNPNTGAWSAMGLGTSGSVYAIVEMQGGDFLVGGNFAIAGGMPANDLARYNPTTGVWSAVAPALYSPSGGDGVSALVALPDGDVVVGGGFRMAGDLTVNRVARLNPATGTWSSLGTGTNDYIFALTVLPDGEIFAGGLFSAAGGVTSAHVARYGSNAGGGSWSALGNGMDSGVSCLAPTATGQVIAGGSFLTTGGVEASHVARGLPTVGGGCDWSTTGFGPIGTILSLEALSNGDFIVGGFFSTAGGVRVNNIARYHANTATWSALGSGVGDTVYALAASADGDLYVGGSFTVAGGVRNRNRIARYNLTTGVWSAMGTGFNDRVSDIVVLPNGDVIAGGSFRTADGMPADRIARYNPANNTWSPIGSLAGNAASRRVNSLVVLPNGDVAVGGAFSGVGGVDASNVARYNPSTNAWSALGTGVNGEVLALAVTPGGTLVAGGLFSAAGDVETRFIAQCNLPTGVWSAMGTGTNQLVAALTVLPSGDVVAGGGFTIAGGSVSAYFGRYTFGSPAPRFTTQPSSQSICSSGVVSFFVNIVSEQLLTYQWRKNAVPLDTVANPSAATSVLVLEDVGTDALGSYDCVVTSTCGSVTSDAATLSICAVDFNCDGFVDFFDHDSFVECLETGICGNGTADFNSDGFVDFSDLFDFVANFEEGC